MYSTALLITNIKNIFLVSVGIGFIFFGTVGNLLNIILFRKRVLWTLSPCTPFLLAASIANTINIYAFITVRMLVGLKINPACYSSVVCKLHLYCYYISVCTSTWFMVSCFVDRFFSSSRNPIIRRYSNIRMTGRIILAITISILLGYSQTLVCYEANQINQPALCFLQNNVCNIVDAIYYFIVQSIAPPIFMLIFDVGTYLHIRQGRQVRSTSKTTTEIGIRTISSIPPRNTIRDSNRHILPMLTIQVTLYMLCSIPLFFIKVYQNIPISIVKSDVRISAENLFLNIAIMISLVDKVFSFYIYTLFSKYYRKEFIKLVTRCRSQQRIAPINELDI